MKRERRLKGVDFQNLQRNMTPKVNGRFSNKARCEVATTAVLIANWALLRQLPFEVSEGVVDEVGSSVCCPLQGLPGGVLDTWTSVCIE